MKALELAPTIPTPNLDEVPNYPETIQGILKRRKANIVEGFIVKRNISDKLGYKFYAEININNSILWLLIREVNSSNAAERFSNL
ncbi:MAG TPA: hypothetical protein VIM16_19685 [Mucilaginibacter sp.]|jgi:hypothetical protein